MVLSSLKAARQIEAQDVEVDDKGEVKLRKGVAKNRRITIEDEEMRHGRKNRTKRFDGYKRHILKDLDLGMVRAVGITMAFCGRGFRDGGDCCGLGASESSVERVTHRSSLLE